MRKHQLILLCLLLPLLVLAQKPTANFSATSVSGCAPFVVMFKDQSSGSPTKWQWDLGNGRSSTLQNPSATYFSPGTYTVTLTATNDAGSNTLMRTAYITVYDAPKPDFVASSTSGCFPFNVQFTDASTASSGTTNTQWSWDFGNGVNSNQQSPLTTFTAVGDYTISLKVTNDKGCSAIFSKPNYIHVPDGIQPGFTNTTINRCLAPFPVTFNNTSTGPGTLSYRWDFGDGTSASGTSVTHNYANPGNYSVSLVVTSSSGCKDTLRKQDLIAIQKITPGFTAPDSICVLSPVAFTNNTSPTPQSTRWDFADGTNSTAFSPTKTYKTAGTYTVRLLSTYSYCTDTTAKSIKILPRPVAQFTSDKTIQCKPPLDVAFKDASTNAVGWLWDFGDGQTSTEQNPVHTYTDYGDFVVKLTVTNRSGCTDSLKKAAYIKIRKPVIRFSNLPQAGCIPYTAKLASTVTTLDKVLSFSWDLGDGSKSTAASLSHVYPNQGNYPVSLTVTTSTGCTVSDTVQNAIVVGRIPVIDFTVVNSACAYQRVTFNGMTNEGDTWAWNFGDGTASSLQNPIHAYADTGNFSVTMSVTNNGCKKSITKNQIIHVNPPIARYTFKKNCNNPLQYFFTDASIGAQTWLWNFGDGVTSNAKNPSHTYASYGTYRVTLSVTNDTCSHVVAKNIIVKKETPSFQADVREACKTATINFSAIVNDTTYIRLYDWRFGNGSKSTDRDPQAIYNQAGNFATTLITTDIYGCKDTAFQNNYIRINGPTAGFLTSNSSGCKGLIASFSDQSVSDGQHPIVSWNWQYGDGQSETLATNNTLQHTYADPGYFAVKLIVNDAAGCSDSLRIDSAVSVSTFSVDFTSKDTLSCLGGTVQLRNLSTAKNPTYEWDLGDGTLSTDAQPSLIYKDTGNYNISLKVSDANGCVDSVLKTGFITVRKTVAAFQVSDTVGGCTPFKVNFSNTSDFYASSLWDFGTSRSTTPNPSTTFLQAGNFPVTLVVTGPGGCKDTATKSIQIYNDSAITFSYSPLENCKSVLLTANVNSPVPMTYTWDFGDGELITTNSADTTHLYATLGSFLPRLIVSDSGSCLLPYTGTDTVRVRGVDVNFGWDRQLFCDSGTIQFIDSTTATETVNSYRWTFGDGATSPLQSPSHYYQKPGNYTVSLTAQSSSGCVDTMTVQNLAKVVASPSIIILGDAAVCQFGTLLHTGAYARPDTSAVQWLWSFPNGATATGIHPPAQVYSVPGNFMLNAVAVNSSGCIDSASKKITVYNLPSVTAPPAVTDIVGTPIKIQPVSYSSNVVNVLWTPDTGLSCTDCAEPFASPKFSTDYTVSVTDSNGCLNSTVVQVIVICQNSNVFVPNTFSPNGDGSNDVFYVRGSGLARVKSLRVFNRLGQVVFERQNFSANDPSAGWDGTYKGVKLPPDTFVYQVDVFCENNDTIRFDGSITLIR